MAQKRTTAMRSALMAGSYARWLNKYNPYPVVAPALGQSLLPIPLSRANGLLETAWHQGETGKHVCRCVDDVLRSCRHPDRAQLFTQNVQRGYDDPEAARPTPDTWFDTDIEFDRDTMETTVTVCSLFANVPQRQAEEFILFAEPALWSERGEFFEASTPGRWDAEQEVVKVDDRWRELMQEFKPNGAPLEFAAAQELVHKWRAYAGGYREGGASEYYIFEHAAWDWSPEEGGEIMNELKIASSDLSADASSQLLRDVYATLQSEMTLAEKEIRAAQKRNPKPSHEQDLADVKERLRALKALNLEQALPTKHAIKFDYGLSRSLQSRFLSSWVRGGLSADDGIYEAAWFETDPGSGLLCIRVDKTICFTRKADVFQDYSKLLNLLAPSLASMLLEELAHHSLTGFLSGRAADADRRTAPPVSGEKWSQSYSVESSAK